MIKHRQKGEKPWSAGTRRTEENRGELKATSAARHEDVSRHTLHNTVSSEGGLLFCGLRWLEPTRNSRFTTLCPLLLCPPLSKFELGLFFCSTRGQAMHMPMARFLVRTLGPLRKWQVISKNDHLSPKWKFPERGL